MTEQAVEEKSDLSSITSSYDNSSICDEIDQLIQTCEQLHSHIHNSFETLEGIQNMIESRNNITITYNGELCDFDEVLEKLHGEALENISVNGSNNFGEKLLKVLDVCEFS
jgi:hypothetical protein